jgi:hypothetical protein
MTPQPIQQPHDAQRPPCGAKVRPPIGGIFPLLGATGPAVPGQRQRPEICPAEQG